MATIHEKILSELFENLVIKFIKENIKSIMQAEIKSFTNDEARAERNVEKDITREPYTPNLVILRIFKSRGIAMGSITPR